MSYLQPAHRSVDYLFSINPHILLIKGYTRTQTILFIPNELSDLIMEFAMCILESCHLLSALLLRAAETNEYSKWSQRSKKKQIPSKKYIKLAISQLKKSSEDSFANQLKVIATCKVLLRYAATHIKVVRRSHGEFDESWLKALSKLLNLKTKRSSESKFQSLIFGLGYYFFSEFWNQSGSADACRLRKRRKFTRLVPLDHIFKPQNIKNSNQMIRKTKYKYMDDNIFNLLKNNE
eukprot:64705_1